MQYPKNLEVIPDPTLAIPGFKEKNMVAVPHTPFSVGPLTTRIWKHTTKQMKANIQGVGDASMAEGNRTYCSKHSPLKTPWQWLKRKNEPCLASTLHYKWSPPIIQDHLWCRVPVPLCSTAQPRCSPTGKKQSLTIFPAFPPLCLFILPFNIHYKTWRLKPLPEGTK